LLTFLLSDAAIVFTSAIVLMILIGLVEAAGLGLGTDFDFDGHDVLSWLGFGRAPMLAVVAIFLAAFGSLGLVGQTIMIDLFGGAASKPLAIAGAAAAALPVTSILSRMLARIMPQDETTAVDPAVLIGQIGTIVVGTARNGEAARTQVHDHFGQVHYVMVEPAMPDQQLKQNDRVLLVRREGPIFRAILHEDAHLKEWTLS
jgi:hypothetical protein